MVELDWIVSAFQFYETIDLAIEQFFVDPGYVCYTGYSERCFVESS